MASAPPDDPVLDGDQSPDTTHAKRTVGWDPPRPHDQLACACYLCRRWRYEQRRNGMLRQEPG